MSGNQSFLQQHHFLLRRLHSLTGIVPIGLFLVAHLTTNSSILWGAFATRGHHTHVEEALGTQMTVFERGWYYFVDEVLWINNQIPHLFVIEVTLWLSIAFHSILGLVYATGGKNNVQLYTYKANWRYTLQRWSGYIGIVFIFYHVATLRWKWDFLVPGGTKWSEYYSASTLSAALRGAEEGWTILGVVVSLLYFFGVTALVFHFANGLWTAAITWGVTVSRTAQRRWGYACAGLGAVMMVMGWVSLGGALAVDFDRAQEIERIAAQEYLDAEAEEDAARGGELVDASSPGAADPE